MLLFPNGKGQHKVGCCSFRLVGNVEGVSSNYLFAMNRPEEFARLGKTPGIYIFSVTNRRITDDQIAKYVGQATDLFERVGEYGIQKLQTAGGTTARVGDLIARTLDSEAVFLWVCSSQQSVGTQSKEQVESCFLHNLKHGLSLSWNKAIPADRSPKCPGKSSCEILVAAQTDL